MKTYWCHLYSPTTGEHELKEVQFPFDNISGVNAYQNFMNRIYSEGHQDKMCFIFASREDAEKAMETFERAHKDMKKHLLVIHSDCYDVLPKTPYHAFHIKKPLDDALSKQGKKYTVLNFVAFQDTLYYEFSTSCKGMNLNVAFPTSKYKENVMFSVKDSLYEVARYFYDFKGLILKSINDWQYVIVITNRIKDVSEYKVALENKHDVTFTAWNIYNKESYKEFIFDNTFYYDGSAPGLSLELSKAFHRLQCKFHNYGFPNLV